MIIEGSLRKELEIHCECDEWIIVIRFNSQKIDYILVIERSRNMNTKNGEHLGGDFGTIRRE